MPAVYSWKSITKTYTDKWSKETFSIGAVELSVKPALNDKKVSIDLPTVCLHDISKAEIYFASISRWVNLWISSIWPINLDSFSYYGVKVSMYRIDMKAASFSPNFSYYEPFFEQGASNE